MMMADAVFMLAKRFTNQDPAGWWLSEKFDGYRAIWTGRNFVSRDGNIFQAPQPWRSVMPSVALDGELYLGRGRFNEMQHAVKCSDWSDLRFMVHDLPEMHAPFEERQAKLASLSLPSFCAVIHQTRCEGVANLQAMFDGIVATGGEGVMLRKPGSYYIPARTDSLLKLKHWPVTATA